MRTSAKVIIVVGCVVAASLVAATYGLFHGYFDPGQFEVKQQQWSSSKQVAMLAERSDHEALGGLTYFVLIGDHLLSPDELRHAYYSDAVVFAAASTCLSLHWEKLLAAAPSNYPAQTLFLSGVRVTATTADRDRPRQDVRRRFQAEP
jgi:hypothetical protein